MTTSRRQFIARSAVASAAAIAAGAGPTTVDAADRATPAIKLKQGATVLLQGDSITDAARDKNNNEPNNVKALGRGYAQLIAYHLLSIRRNSPASTMQSNGLTGRTYREENFVTSAAKMAKNMAQGTTNWTISKSVRAEGILVPCLKRPSEYRTIHGASMAAQSPRNAGY